MLVVGENFYQFRRHKGMYDTGVLRKFNTIFLRI